jgi:uncharacterized protein with PQ loop repeat
MNKEVFGYIGATLLVLSVFPQIYKSYIEKNVNSLSYPFIVLQIITCIFILTYVSLNLDYPLMGANSIIMLQFIFLLGLKYYFTKYPDKTNKKEETINDIRDNNIKDNDILRVNKVSEV